MSVKEPDLSFNLLDKLLVTIYFNQIEPIICLTKVDMLSSKENKDLKEIIKYYQKIGIKTVKNTELKKLTKYIHKKTVVLCGQTGAGKSSLLNRLDETFDLKTNPISKSLGRGIHTTRHVELFKYKTSLIADTPGFSSLELNELSIKDIKDAFLEFNVDCEYDDCNHLNEENCKVKELVESNKILKSRYINYQKFVRENESISIVYKK